jgi:NAD(P)-dependent dehydrogenase (short-subunit alcohol dehydrogenase family)
MGSEVSNKLGGKVALVTGGSRGIGKAVASAYAREGAKVFICARNERELNRAVLDLRSEGGEVQGRSGDVGNAGNVKRIVGEATGHFGAIDVLVNNASLLGPREAIAEYPIEAWEDVVRVNLTGLFLVTREVLKMMLPRQRGSIINVSSGVGRVGKARWGAYAASKFGVEGLTQVLSEEVREIGIRVNSVNPGPTRTEMRAMAYPSEDPLTLPAPDEIVPIFLYLASDDSINISGQSLEAREWLAARN